MTCSWLTIILVEPYVLHLGYSYALTPSMVLFGMQLPYSGGPAASEPWA